MYVNTPTMQNFGFENRVHWPTRRHLLILVRVLMASDWFTRIYRSILAKQFLQFLKPYDYYGGPCVP